MVILGQRQQKAVATGVHVALLERVAHGVALRRTGAAERIVAAAGVGGDGQHGVAFIGQQGGTRGQVDIALSTDGVVRVVTLLGIIGIVEQRVHRLVAFQVENAQHLSFGDAAHKGLPRGYNLAEDRRVRGIVTFANVLSHELFSSARPAQAYRRSVLIKARSFSGQW